MYVLLILLVVFAVIAMLSTYFGQRLKSKGTDELTSKSAPEPVEECCGAHEVCETDLLLKMSEEIIYYEDEELDVYKNFEENDFNDDQIDEFREVLYSLKENEIEAWLHSLELRHIKLPSIIKSELVFMLVKN
ncbi:hypothetical protein [Labilibaculum sp.]|uniref:hypothetical protein n=1 Tax=Labilibaculum sp. TaxID=2060723 RepID=UPI00356A01EF